MEQETRNTSIPSPIVGIWQRIVDVISDLLSVPSVMINRLEPPELVVFRSNISSNNPFPSGTRMQMAGIYCEAAAKRRQRVQIEDARKDPLWADSPTAKAGIFAYLGYPLFWPNGEVFGTICTVDTKENQWGKRYDSLLKTFKDAIEAHLALVNTTELLNIRNEEVERLAITDSLTGLYNRRHFFELAEHELQHARRYRRFLSAIMLDIDHFKQVNDTYGHAIGDQVLQVVAEGCRQATRVVDVLGRYGGEEFVIILPETDLVATCKVAERLRQIIAEKTIDTEVGPVIVTASLGVSIIDDECSKLETLLAGADQALYVAKRSGRNRVCSI